MKNYFMALILVLCVALPLTVNVSAHEEDGYRHLVDKGLGNVISGRWCPDNSKYQEWENSKGETFLCFAEHHMMHCKPGTCQDIIGHPEEDN